MEIKVTQRHIDRAHVPGTPGKWSLCPIEWALYDLGYAVKVYLSRVHFLSVENLDLALPTEAENFVYAFDDGESVEPFAFDLDIPASVPKSVREE